MLKFKLKEITISQVLAYLENYKGLNVFWSERIVDCLNKENLTFLEIVEFLLDLESKPLSRHQVSW